MASPKLRFKEFDGDWSNSLLGDLIGISSASRVFKDQWKESGVPFYRTSDVVSFFKGKDNEKAFISIELFEELAKKSGKIKKDDLLVTGGGTIGIPYLVPNNEPLYFKDADLLWLKSSGVIEGSFLYNFFVSPKFREYLKSISHTGTISHFTIEQAKATSFNFPTQEEQTKIASFLSAVDEKISQLNQKHELLSQYKQGMMQKLFSQQIRFKADDGSEFGEWENKKLAEVCHFINGRAYKQTEWEKEGIPVIRLQNLTGSGKDYYYSNLNLPNHQYCYNNDLLYMWSATFGPVFWQGEKAIFHYHIWKIEVNPQLLDKKYMYFLLDEMTEKMKKSLNGSTMLHVTKQGMDDTVKTIPSLKEQTKIANFLSAIDQKIEVAAQQIKQAKTWKKGLLQQMFV